MRQGSPATVLSATGTLTSHQPVVIRITTHARLQHHRELGISIYVHVQQQQDQKCLYARAHLITAGPGVSAVVSNGSTCTHSRHLIYVVRLLYTIRVATSAPPTAPLVSAIYITKRSTTAKFTHHLDSPEFRPRRVREFLQSGNLYRTSLVDVCPSFV